MSLFRTGIDRRRDWYRLARVADDGGRPRVVSLWTAESPSWPEGDFVAFSVPDSAVIFKTLYLPEGHPADLQARARFEIEQALLDDPAEYESDLLPGIGDDRYFAQVMRRSHIAQIRHTLHNGNSLAAPGPRSIALARGYRAFCRPPGGDVICLADVVDNEVSVAILYRNKPAASAFLNLGGADFAVEADCRRFAIELKTVVNFRLSALADQGVTVPLSKLLISGESVTDTAVGMLETLFPCGVRRPDFNMAFFDNSEELRSQLSDSCLAALGLAVN